jgi:transcriptional regulator with XRE-family HTH domain
MNQEKIGKFICELRKEKNLTQKELADKLNITDRAVSKWENGRGLPDLSLLMPLCKELDISINELLSGERLNKK